MALWCHSLLLWAALLCSSRQAGEAGADQFPVLCALAMQRPVKDIRLAVLCVLQTCCLLQ